ncbi:hypothetical protein B0H14DRAFT_2565829 [Mycena olivaceomarginata]|nr:hypothetical protein B0H14DRAFT_2599385 [Mycena olivaceomarginata]KAJ7881606.1 hypothetical protein B0H14DRAFT_2565829 [Mycena olivaceomarginata]
MNVVNMVPVANARVQVRDQMISQGPSIEFTNADEEVSVWLRDQRFRSEDEIDYSKLAHRRIIGDSFDSGRCGGRSKHSLVYDRVPFGMSYYPSPGSRTFKENT